jgi:type IV pilus assembly protein PilZ
MVPADDDWADRRASPRQAITLRVDYKRVNTFFADYAKNISKGGTFIQTDRPLEIGTEFVFLLSIPGREAAIELRGQVMWTVAPSAATEEHPAGMGIRFIFERDQERRSLHALVESLMSDKLGPRVTRKLLGKK